ncbi:MAG: hypothetical protein HY313_06830 [Acidobacteria bacterium]|nr:hypothetical protein [Acidobacteriota bacterium]
MEHKKNQQQDPLGVKPSTSQSQAFKNDLKWIKRVGYFYAVIFGTLITWYLPKELVQLRDSVNGDIVKQLQPIGERLSKIEGRLLNLAAFQNPGETIKEIAALSPKDFPHSLPALRKITERPVSEVKPTVDILRELVEKLRNIDESSPDYWPTLLQFIQFASASFSPDVPPPGKPTSIISNNTVRVSVRGVKKAIVLLDGGELVDSDFENSRIIFTPNPVRMRNVRFTNCVFEIPLTETPNQYIKSASQQLLASNLQSVSISSL